MKQRTKLMKKYFKKRSGQEDHSVQSLLAETMQEAQKRAKKLLCIEDVKVSKPLVISMPDLGKGRKLQYRITKLENDQYIVHYNYAVFSTIYFSEDTLFYHNAIVNNLTGKVDADITGEISLYDIIHIETSLTYDTYNGTPSSLLTLTLNLVDGDHISFPIRKHILLDDYTYPELLTKEERYVIETIKKAVRSVK